MMIREQGDAGQVTSRSVLLIVGGGIAAYKSLELVRLLTKANIAVRPLLTRAGAEFVTPLSLSALSGSKVYQLSRSADLVVVAPATADLMAKAAHGHASDLATTTLLATDKPVLMAPAMNVRMWEHPATQRNLATLRADGVTMVGPDEGAMACGEFGPGRMAEPEAILAAVSRRGHRDPWPVAGRWSRPAPPMNPSIPCDTLPTDPPVVRDMPSPRPSRTWGRT
jgi:phosphopantothenoylcysteine decarboxylase / phosphopantothenate---cysteine ligase